jgi:DNA-binding Lrp family transcriptional regulator
MSLPLVQDRAVTGRRARTALSRLESTGRVVENLSATKSPIHFDEIGRQILIHLQENARISNVDLANRVGLSAAPCLRRVRVLERTGVIRRYVSLLDPRMVGLPTTVWIQVRLDLQVARRFDTFEQQIRRLPEVLECYLMAGEADYLVRVAVRDVAGYERFLRTRLSQIEGVVSTNSSFVLKVVKYSTVLPVKRARADVLTGAQAKLTNARPASP